MAVAGPFGTPEESPSIFEQCEIILQVNEGGVLLGENRAHLTASHVGCEQLENILPPVQPLQQDFVAARQPLGPHDVVVRCTVGLNFYGFARLDIDDPEYYCRVGLSRFRVTLQFDVGLG